MEGARRRAGKCGAMSYNDYYKDMLKKGLEFQDVVTRELYQRGIVIVGYASQKYQNEAGENMLGAEIKHDMKFKDTGNLYIEVAEKSHPDKPDYTPSGIYRKDNSWLYVIGNEEEIYIFSTKILRMIEGKFFHPEPTPTSKGFLIPTVDAEKYCIRKIDLRVRPGDD